MTQTSNNEHIGESKTIRIFGLVPESIVDGPGLRFSVFVQGCSHDCPGCHNPESHPADGGKPVGIADLLEQIRGCSSVHDVTLSGGEPFEQAGVCAELAKQLKNEGYGIWAFTGYLLEDLERMAKSDPCVASLLGCIDVLVDGPFIESLRSLELDWRGSSNQRVIDLERTRALGRIVEWKQPEMIFEKPENW